MNLIEDSKTGKGDGNSDREKGANDDKNPENVINSNKNRDFYIASQKKRMAIEVIGDVISTNRALLYIKDKDENILNLKVDVEDINIQNNAHGLDLDFDTTPKEKKGIEITDDLNYNEKLSNEKKMNENRGGFFNFWKNLRKKIGKLFEIIPKGSLKGWIRHNQGAFCYEDSLAEIFILGTGPLGFLGFSGTSSQFIQVYIHMCVMFVRDI